MMADDLKKSGVEQKVARIWGSFAESDLPYPYQCKAFLRIGSSHRILYLFGCFL